jgi:hypothetical protein
VFDRCGLRVRDADALRIESIWANIYPGGKTPRRRACCCSSMTSWRGAGIIDAE